MQVMSVKQEDFGPNLTPLLWKAIFDFDKAKVVYRVPKLNDETLNYRAGYEFFHSFDLIFEIFETEIEIFSMK